MHTKKRGAPKGNINAKGNSGGAALKGNSNAVTHGLFAKFLPDETLEIMEHINECSPKELIWDQIQYATIIRAQKIMLVQDKHEMIKELKKTKYEYYPRPEEEGGGVEQTVIEEEFQFAWDRHATFLNAQSRAMGELRSLIKQFVTIAGEADERRMRLEMMNLQMDKIRADTEKVKASSNNGDTGMSVMIVNDLNDDD